MPKLPDVTFGTTETKLPPWHDKDIDMKDDDEELSETPSDVVALLGFDPLKEW